MTRAITLMLGAAALALAVALAPPAMRNPRKSPSSQPLRRTASTRPRSKGVEEKAMELGYEAEIYDGKFDAVHQYSQIEDVLASGASRA